MQRLLHTEMYLDLSAHTNMQTRRHGDVRGGSFQRGKVLLCVSEEATGWINIHVEQQQMPPSPSNAHSSLPLHSHPLTSYHLLTPVSHPYLFLMKNTPGFALPFPINLSSLQPAPLPLVAPYVVSCSLSFPSHLRLSFFYSTSLLIMQATC